jgi:hypothetical protein
MNRLSAIDSFAPAMERVTRMLFRPFRLKTWLKIGFIGLLSGGVARLNSSFNFRPPVFPSRGGGRLPEDPMAEITRAIHSIHLANYFHLIAAALITIVALSLVFLYLFCRFRFVLFDSIISGQAVVGRGWRRYASQGNRFFGFWLVFRLVNWAVMALIIGVPLWHAYKSGVFSGDDSLIVLLQMIASIALGAIAAGMVFAVISTLMKDFIMPIMALDDLTLGDAWTALWRVIASEPRAWAGYLGMKLVLTIGAAIALAIAGVIALIPAVVILGIPVGILVGVGVAALKAAGMAAGIALFCVAGLVAAAGALCLYMVLTAPITVFFASYAFYFFGGRYPKLGALLSPQPSPVPQAQSV